MRTALLLPLCVAFAVAACDSNDSATAPTPLALSANSATPSAAPTVPPQTIAAGDRITNTLTSHDGGHGHVYYVTAPFTGVLRASVSYNPEFGRISLQLGDTFGSTNIAPLINQTSVVAGHQYRIVVAPYGGSYSTFNVPYVLTTQMQ